MPKRSQPELYTSTEAAEKLGVNQSRIRQLAIARSVGTKAGRDWVFTRADIQALKPGPSGRPPKSK